MEIPIILLIIVVFAFVSVLMLQYKIKKEVRKQQERRSRNQNMFSDDYSRVLQSMYRPPRNYRDYRSGLTAGRAGTMLHNTVEQYYKAERARIDKESKEEAKQNAKEAKIRHEKELEEQRIKKEKIAYKKPGRSSRVEKAARILDELEDSKKRKVN